MLGAVAGPRPNPHCNHAALNQCNLLGGLLWDVAYNGEPTDFRERAIWRKLYVSCPALCSQDAKQWLFCAELMTCAGKAFTTVLLITARRQYLLNYTSLGPIFISCSLINIYYGEKMIQYFCWLKRVVCWQIRVDRVTVHCAECCLYSLVFDMQANWTWWAVALPFTRPNTNVPVADAELMMLLYLSIFVRAEMLSPAAASVMERTEAAEAGRLTMTTMVWLTASVALLALHINVTSFFSMQQQDRKSVV